MQNYSNRTEAGLLLAERLARRGYKSPVILALPRGGLPVALEVSRALKAPMDLVLVRKIGVPFQPELAAGAVVDGGHPEVVLNSDVIALSGMSKERLDEAVARQLEEIERRRNLYLKGRPRPEIAGKTAIVIDDGIATGATMRAALKALRRRKPKKLVLAVPVAPPDTIEALRGEADDVVCLQTPEPFMAIGIFYRDFHQVRDQEVIAILHEANGLSRKKGPGKRAGEGTGEVERPFDYAKAKLDPAAVFSTPEDVLESNHIPTKQKIEILRRWHYDAAETSVAAEEGMGDGNGDLLQRINRALDHLTGGLDLEHSPPTKQGGLDRDSIKERK